MVVCKECFSTNIDLKTWVNEKTGHTEIVSFDDEDTWCKLCGEHTGAMELDFRKIDNVEIEGIDHKDYPDYCDAFLVSADYDGEEMTEEQLENLANEYRRDYTGWLHEKVHDYLH